MIKDILIPWKPTLAEHPKSLGDLLIADRGGMIFEPIVGVHAALAYDAMRVLADAIARARTTDSGPLRDALAQTKDFAGVTGVISMDANRNAVKPAVVLKLMDVKYIYQETIQPETPAPSPSPSASPSPTKKK